MKRKKMQKKLYLKTIIISKVDTFLLKEIKGGRTNTPTGIFCNTCEC